MLIYLNGEFLSREEAKVSILDHGYLFGDGVFDTLRSYDGVLFSFDPHLERFFNSAKYMGIEVPRSREEIRKIVPELLRKSGLKDAYLRMTVSRGIGDRGIDPAPCKFPTLSIIAKELPRYPDTCYADGIPSMVVSVRKTPDEALSGRIKSCNGQNHILAKMELNRHRLIEGILLNMQGDVAEGTASNLFLVKKGVLMTPSLASGCLEGITRNAVIEIAGNEPDLIPQEANIRRSDLYEADECFFTNTLIELLPVVAIDGKMIGSGRPGPVTRALSRRFRDHVKRVCSA